MRSNLNGLFNLREEILKKRLQQLLKLVISMKYGFIAIRRLRYLLRFIEENIPDAFGKKRVFQNFFLS